MNPTQLPETTFILEKKKGAESSSKGTESPPQTALHGGTSPALTNSPGRKLVDAAKAVIQLQRDKDHHEPRFGTHNLDRQKDFSFDSGTKGLIRFLRTVPHLYMVSKDELQTIANSILRREYNLGDEVMAAGQEVSHVYVVLSGCVEVFLVEGSEECRQSAAVRDCGIDPTGARKQTARCRVGTVLSGNLFMIDSIVFNEPSPFVYKAGSRSLLGLIPVSVFDDALKRCVMMRQSIARKLADHMDIFICFKDFCRHIFSHESAKHEYLPIWHILDAYYHLNNSIHSKMLSSEVDTGAWGYAIKRLPENITRTFCFDLARALPPFLAKRMRDLARSADKNDRTRGEDIKYIATKERRRCSWQLGMEGKTLVLLRDGFTDLIDFITCLCIHIIESNKLRGRLQGMVHPPAIDIIDRTLHPPPGEVNPFSMLANSNLNISATTVGRSNQSLAGLDFTDAIRDTTKEVLRRMPLEENERTGLMRMWPTNCLQNIYSVIMHREEFMLRVDASVSRRFQTDPFHEWSLNLRGAVMRKMKLSPQGRLPDDLVVDIISSNTHCTKSILSSFARKYRDSILEYVSKKRPELNSLNWVVEEDMVYAALNGFVQDANLKEQYNAALQSCGLEVMEDTALTGLQVDVVPVASVDLTQIDPLLASRQCSASGKHHFILNMDFAFGAQADGITKTLVETFGKHIRSFNVMGKAGGISETMNRGDIQLASHVLLSKSSLTTEDYLDELRHCGNEDISADFLRELLGTNSKVQIFEGPVLTIPGTMLQNTKLLQYYSKLWNCVGLEMEGSYFCRQLRESIKAGLLHANTITRFAYYTSDLPLRAATGDASLAVPMRPNEGVPPLYCIARALLCRILNAQEPPRTAPGTPSSS